MTINIKENIKTGTHRVQFKVIFPGNYMVTLIDARFTYKRLNSKIKAICKKVNKQVDDIISVEII